MRASLSLRSRLFALILAPLLLMAILLGYWRYTVAQSTAEVLFDRSLLATAMAISRDVAISGGDALLPSTRDLISDATGGEVFYHVTGPGGIYVTGYAYPPAAPKRHRADPYQPEYFKAVYRGEPVRVLRVTERTTIGNLSGDATVTVWQRMSERNAFARDLAVKAAGLLGALLVTLALVVWFGVQRGLRPLVDLQGAIAARSPEDLSTIKRPVPAEARGIVDTLNRLFGQVEKSIDAHQVFISDAAHQLRNPVAAVQSMAEAVRDAPDGEEKDRRINELIEASRGSARVTDQLLSLDRLRHRSGELDEFDLNQLTREVCTASGTSILAAGVELELEEHDDALPVHADRFFVAEALKNLIDNARKHGGADLTKISVQTARAGGAATVTVSDDGVGLSPEDTKVAFSRFSQIEPSGGSGLGLAIAHSVAIRHGGDLRILPVARGARLVLTLPVAKAA